MAPKSSSLPSAPRNFRRPSNAWVTARWSSTSRMSGLISSRRRRANMKASAGRVLMLVENCFPADTRVRNEAFTLAANGFKVSVIALRGPAEARREVVRGVTVYRIPRLTLFEKLPEVQHSRITTLLNRLRVVVGYFSEYIYFTSACLLLSVYVAATEGVDVVHAHNPPDT